MKSGGGEGRGGMEAKRRVCFKMEGVINGGGKVNVAALRII